MKQPAPVYQRIAVINGDISGFLAIYTVVLSSCAANYGIVVLIRGEIYLSQWETLSIVGRKVYVVCSYWNNIGFVR